MQTTAFPKEVDANSDKKLLETLARSKIYRQYERTFSEATGSSADDENSTTPRRLRYITKT